MMKKPKRWKTVLVVALLILVALTVIFLKAPLYYQARSYTIMYFYSKYEMKNSILQKQNIAVEIPGGSSTKEKDWFPFMMTFNDDQGFSDYRDRDLALTVLYNFGAFSWNSSSSSFFNNRSPWYNSFYGGYVVKENSSPDKVYGFNSNGEPAINEIFAVAEYDYKYLVMKSLGCPQEKLVMDISSYKLTPNVSYAGYDGWIQIDSILRVNSPSHKFVRDRRAYIQYGNPLRQTYQEDFQMMRTYGRTYARYFPEFKSTIFLYIVSSDQGTLSTCDKQILSKSTISEMEKK